MLIRMHKNRALWLGIIIFVMVILVGAKTYLSPRAGTYTAPNNQIAVETAKKSATSETVTTTKNSTDAQTKAISPAVSVDPQEKCVLDTQKSLKDKGITYEKGSLLVTFEKDVSWQQGKDILADYNVAYSAETNAQGGFTTKSWVDVTVPVGQEVALLCMLQDNPSISYVNVNQIFKLHE